MEDFGNRRLHDHNNWEPNGKDLEDKMEAGFV